MGNTITKNSNFKNDLIQIFAIQTVFQLILSIILEYATLLQKMEFLQYVFASSFFFIFLVITFSLKHSIANKVLIFLFSLQFFFLAVTPIFAFVNQIFFNLYNILNASFLLFTTTYLFFHSISPRENKTLNHFFYALLLTIIISTLTYYEVGFIVDYSKLGGELLRSTLDTLYLSSYNIFLVNISLLIFVWIIYSQGQYVLSEYLSSIIAMHTLIILNEVYQLYNYKYLIENYINGIVFNFVINFGLILIWIIRLNYISKPENKKNEKYVLNYDLLKGYVEKPNEGIWGHFLAKLGKQNMFIGSFILLSLIIIPIIFLGDMDIFNRMNIILMFLFVFIMIVYAIIYTQRRWYNHIGFLFKKTPRK